MLKGVKVVEFGQNLAGPFAGQILAHMGAEVIKVERPGPGDDARAWGPPFVGDSAVGFHIINQGKKSVSIDLEKEADRQALVELIGRSDVFLHNLRPGVVQKFGIDGPSLLKRFPGLIYADIGAFGHKGPLTMKPGYEPLLQAFSGLVSVNGHPDGPPARIGASVVDYGTGMWTTIGILAALVNRAQTGKGTVINTSLFETALGWAGPHLSGFGATGTVSPRQGTGHPSLVPYEGFETTTGTLVITAGNQRIWAKLCTVLGHPEWKDDPKFVDNKARRANKAELLGLIAAIMIKDSKEAWTEKMEKAGVPCAPIHTIAEVLAHPQTAAMGALGTLPGTEIPFTGLPISFDGERPAAAPGAPAAGADTLTTLRPATR